MIAAIFDWSLTIAQIMLVLAMSLSALRAARGPRAQDRVLAFDSLYVGGMLLIITFGIRSGSTAYFEAALIISVIGFVATAALAKFLMRGEVIE
jgi:multicomponent K+:H+ antiporter subunit F